MKISKSQLKQMIAESFEEFSQKLNKWEPEFEAWYKERGSKIHDLESLKTGFQAGFYAGLEENR